MFQKDIEQQLRKMTQSEMQRITVEELFRSPEFAEHLQGLSDTMMVLDSKKSAVPVCVVDNPTAPPGWTEGKTVCVNADNTVAAWYAAILQKFICERGIAFHEFGHILFCDFDMEKKALASIKSGAFYGDLPTSSTDMEAAALEDMLNAMKEPAYRPIFVQVFDQLCNIIDDPHDEGKIIERFGGIVEQGIVLARESLFQSMCFAEDLTGEDSKLSAIYDLFLQYARFGKIHMKDQEACLQENELVQKVMECSDDLMVARWTDDVTLRCSKINRIMLCLWPYIEEALKEIDTEPPEIPQNPNADPNSSGDNGGPGEADGGGSQSCPPESQQNNGAGADGSSTQPSGQAGTGAPFAGNQPGQPEKRPPSAKAVQHVLDQLSKAADSIGGSPAPKKGRSSSEAKENRKQAGIQPTPAFPHQDVSEVLRDTSDAQGAMNGILQKIAKRKAMQSLERDLDSQRMEEIKELKGEKNSVPVTVIRVFDYDDSDVELYERQMADGLRAYSDRLQRYMREALRDLQQGGVTHHKMFGKRFEANNAYRLDQRFYADKQYPVDWPSMCICLQVDLSGSCRGVRLNAEMRAAMLLYDFARGLGIPVFVAGHHAPPPNLKVTYRIYSDFDGFPARDCYRLAHMYAGGNNHDGAALEISAGLLAKRPEDVKLLFILSDGQPNYGSYRGEAARKDLQEIVAKYRRQGIEFIAAAFGDDRDKIKAIYGNSYLDITDLSKLPKTLTSMVTKRILR